MMMLTFEEALKCLQSGKVIAYPTEAVYGLGCSPLNETAVMKLLALKARSVHKGLILISDEFKNLEPYVDQSVITNEQIQAALDTWPGPYTWVFPASALVPSWIKGDFDSVAIRVIQHPVATPLCRAFGMPLVSTSANKAGFDPARTITEVLDQFPEGLEGILEGPVDRTKMPSKMRDVRTQAILRS